MASLVLLLHGALIELFNLSLRVHESAPADRGTLQASLLPDDHSGAGEKPQIEPGLRRPEIPGSDFALEIPIVVPVEPNSPRAIRPSPEDTAAAPVPTPNDEKSDDSSTGAAAGSGEAGTSTVREVSPAYPPAAFRSGHEGDVVVALTADSSGEPIDVRVRESSGYADLDQAAVHAFLQWKFERSPGRPSREILLRAGFGLAGPPPPFLPETTVFIPEAVARINASTRPITREAPNADKPLPLITALIETLRASMYPNSSDSPLLRRFARVYVSDPAVPLTGSPPWPRKLDFSPLLNVRLMGRVTLKDPEVDGERSETRVWYAFAVSQKLTTSEWLLDITPAGTINRAWVMTGGPPCTAAPDSAACVAAP